MGYYTKHSLTVIDGDKEKDYEQEVADKTGNYDKYWLWNDETKWHECHTDMINYSLTHPNVTFLIDGEGEDGKQWKAWFKNGKMFKTKVKTVLLFEEFSEDKLK